MGIGKEAVCRIQVTELGKDGKSKRSQAFTLYKDVRNYNFEKIVDRIKGAFV